MQTHQTDRVDARGLRPVTPALLRAEKFAAAWRGMPEGVTKATLLRLLEDVPAKMLGISRSAREYLAYTVKMQPAKCFSLGAGPLALISTLGDAHLSAALDTDLRTLPRWRNELIDAGWISVRDAPDRKRYRNGPAEEPYEAYGVDLRPLVVRLKELNTLRDRAKAHFLRKREALRTLGRLKNRLHGLRAYTWSPADAKELDRGLSSIEAVRRRKDLDMIEMGVREASTIAERLQTLASQGAAEPGRPSSSTGLPDKTGAQFLPTHPPQINKLSVDDEDAARDFAQREEGSAVVSADPGQIEWVADDYEEPDEADVIEVTAVRPLSVLDTCPMPQTHEIIEGLPAIFASRGLRFSRPPEMHDDDLLIEACAEASANRLGLKRQARYELIERLGERRFAVCVLLAEFSDNVAKPKGYLYALTGRIESGYVKVDLWASWKRLVRVAAQRRLQ